MPISIDKAVKLCTAFAALPFDANLANTREAIRLGIEAMAYIQTKRQEAPEAPEELLPGECW